MLVGVLWDDVHRSLVWQELGHENLYALCGAIKRERCVRVVGRAILCVFFTKKSEEFQNNGFVTTL